MKRLKLKIKSGFADPAQESKSLTDAVRQAIEAENDAICQYRQYAALAKEEDAEKQVASAPAITVQEAALGDTQPEVIDLNQQDYKDFVQDQANNNPDDNV